MVFPSRDKLKGFMIFLCVILFTEIWIYQLWYGGKIQAKKIRRRKIFNYNNIILQLRKVPNNMDMFWSKYYNITDLRLAFNESRRDMKRLMEFVQKVAPKGDWSGLVGSDIKEERVAILDPKQDALDHIRQALQIDFKYTLKSGLVENQDWILFYSIHRELDFTMFTNLKPHQLVSVIPGTNSITHKKELSSIHLGISHIKPAFNLPGDKELFISYVKANPDALWLQKGHRHRGIKLIEPQEILSGDFDGSKYFIQEFIKDPFLLENRKFDIGIHAVITSAHPLRLYVDSGEWQIKVCVKNFYPFNRSDTDSYIEQDRMLNLYGMKSMSTYVIERDLNKKEALLQYLHDTGHDQSHVERSIYEALAEVGAVKEAGIWNATQERKLPSDYKNRNYFELIRFDVVLDSKLQPWVNEANFAPFLGRTAGKKKRGPKGKGRQWGNFGPYLGGTAGKKESGPKGRGGQWNKLPENYSRWNTTTILHWFLKRKGWNSDVAKSMLTLVGIPFTRVWADETDEVDDELINVDTEKCEVQKDCNHWESAVCWRCLDDEDKLEMKRAYLEHYRKGAWKRVTPRPLNDQETARRWRPKTDILYQKLTQRGKRSFLWFRLMCLQRVEWCQ